VSIVGPTEMERITSIKDHRVVEARGLTSSSARRRSGKCLLEGDEVIAWALAADVPVERVFVHDKIEGEGRSLLDDLRERGVTCFAVSEGILKKLTGRRYLVPLVGVARWDGSAVGPPGDFVIVLDGVQDHGNLGTIVRTARGFGIRDVVAVGDEVDLLYRKALRTSRGTVFGVRLRRFSSALEATSPYGSALQSTAQLEDRPLALAVGNETDGVSDEMDLVVQIPMSRVVESLNVGVATGISIYEFKLKLVMAMLEKRIRGTLGREVNVAGKLIQRSLDAALRDVSRLNSTQVILLMVLRCDEEMSLAQVGKDTATFGDEQAALLQPLFDGGHIAYVEGARERIRLTESGEQLIGQLWGVVEAAEDGILAGFSDSERRQLFDFLRRIQVNCINACGRGCTGQRGQRHSETPF